MEKNYKPFEIAEMLDVGIKTVYKWIAAGRLKAHKFGPSRLRIYQSDLDRFTGN